MKFNTYSISELIDEIAMGPFGSNIKVECFVDDGIPVLNGSNLNGFFLTEDSFRYVTETKADSLGRANAHRGDIVITHRGTLGQIVCIPETSKYDRYVISQSQFRVKCNEKVLPEYLVYYFHTAIGQHKLLSNASQVGVPALARASTTFQKIEVEIPDIKTQQKVVSVLNAIEAKINVNRSINENLEQQAKALYQQMFIENTCPDWIEGSLRDIADITMGQSPSGSSFNEDGIGTIFFQGRAEFSFRFPTIRLYTTEPKRMAYANDILMSVRAPVGDLNIAHTDCCIGRGLAAIHSKTNHQSFVLYTMFSLRKQLDVFNGEGTVFGSINRNSLNDMPILIPSDETIEEFEKIVAPMDAAIRNNYDEICRLQAVRDSLLPRLMSGELDVSSLDI
ncbi:restriction endonuclease subunit S [Blautia producta]|uniref:restriction endonuclease subunit S n=1 Tax=Blautia producta TaxID=33035 RepID=UPI00210886FA|nr:restriction endonuclease subunit S [Blautia producta]MCQ5125337.1 restriction endonuclease subunit S [Blautia producta]